MPEEGIVAEIVTDVGKKVIFKGIVPILRMSDSKITSEEAQKLIEAINAIIVKKKATFQGIALNLKKKDTKEKMMMTISHTRGKKEMMMEAHLEKKIMNQVGKVKWKMKITGANHLKKRLT